MTKSQKSLGQVAYEVDPWRVRIAGPWAQLVGAEQANYEDMANAVAREVERRRAKGKKDA